MASLGNLVAGVAHELNTPIGNALLSSSAFMERINEIAGSIKRGDLGRTAFEAFMEDSSQLADLIHRQCHRAGQLIASFKRVAIDQTSEQRRTFQLHDLIDDHIAALDPSLMHSRWQIEREVPTDIACDSYPGPLGQVIDNLIQNAGVHAFGERESGRLQIHAHCDGTMVQLQFTDDGKGIAEQDQHHIFDPFFTTRLGQGGSGLGLFIAKNIVTGLLGGALTVRSEVGKGSCFLIRFPLLAPNPLPPSQSLSQSLSQPLSPAST